MCQDWISTIITRHGPMRAETSIGCDSGSRCTHEQNYFRVLGLGYYFEISI
jgi:hypothetical protein